MEKIPEYIHNSWHEYLQPLFDDKKMMMIKTQLLPRCKFYPESDKIFRVFSMPFDSVKVVILGQDPYYNGSANGYAFAVNQSTPIPKSLQIIKAEIIRSEAKRDMYTDIETPKWKTLQHWAEQGVFLLNTALTVEVGLAGSHTGQWQWFTREVIKVISQHNKVLWLLWGAKAKSFKDYIISKSIVQINGEDISVRDIDGNIILEADHPAAETYNPASKAKFTGCNHFYIANKVLESQDKKIINW